MSKSFKGIWGTFPHVDEAATVVQTLRSEKKDYSVLSPCPRHEFFHAMGSPQSYIPWITLVFGALGIFFGYGFPSWTALDWVIPVSQKPIVGIPAFTIIGFELMVLLGGVSTAVFIFLLGYLDLFRKRLPGSDKFKRYGRFSVDRFGVVVRCEEGEAAAVERLMRDHSAEEVVREF
jgi:molybdopterin-containing oxidoreductase family membrane subunit